MKYNKKWGRTVEKDVAIKVTHVSKDFKLYYDKANTLKEKILFFQNDEDVNQFIWAALFTGGFTI